MHICLIIRFLFKVWFCVFSVLHVRYFKELFFQMVERTMAFKHYDVVRAAPPSDLAEKLTHKLKEGGQPFGSPVAITPYTLMQAIAAEGDVVVSGATEPE